MEPEQIIKLVQGLSKKLKDKQGKIADCDWYGTYKEQKELCDYISVHAQLNKFPDQMMRRRAPNETEEELSYRKDNFEPITMPYWYRAVNSINGRIWSAQNHKVSIEDEEVKKYFLEEYPVHGSIIQYFKSIVTNYKVNDPNAVLALKVEALPEYETEGGEVKIDETAIPEASLQIYGCDKIIMFSPGKFALFMSDEKSEVIYYNKKVMEGLVFILYDSTTIYKIKQVGDKVAWSFEAEIQYEHKLDYLPVWKLKGIPKQVIKDTQQDLVYYSYFIPAVPLLNKVLKQDSSLDASISKVAFPTRVYYEDECDEPSCEQGKVAVWKEGSTEKSYASCPKCGGSGKGGMKFSPMKDYIQRPPKKNITEEEAPLPFPALAFVSPDPAILKFLEEKIKNEIVEAFTFINIDVSNKGDNTGSQTGIEVKIDREELFSFLLHFSSELFELLNKGMTAIASVRYQDKNEEKLFDIKPPRTFEIYSADELTIELGEAKKAGVPEIAIREMTKDYMTQRFAQQGGLAKIIDLVFKIDGYATKDTTEIAILKSNGLILLWQAILHEEIYQFIDQEVEKDSGFLDKKLADQRAALETLAKARAAELTPNTAGKIVDDLAGGGV